MTVLADPVLSIRDASDISLEGLVIEASRGNGIDIDGGFRIRLTGMTFEALGGRAIDIRGGSANTVSALTIQDVGAGGVSIDAGDRATLTPSRDVIEQVRIRDFARWIQTNAPAVNLRGVGTTVRECEISDGPHSGIILDGNDHLIEDNTFYRLLLETKDAGAIYIGRDWTARGNVIRDNFFLEIGGNSPKHSNDGIQAVYLDDMASGVTVERNVFYRVPTAVLIGGGRDNHIDDNVIVQSDAPLYIDARGRFWRSAALQGRSGWESSAWGGLVDMFNRARPDSSPYKERYPSLRRALIDQPGDPIGNTFVNNFLVGGGDILRNGVTADMLAERGTVRIPQSETVEMGPPEIQALLDSLSRSGSRPLQRLPKAIIAFPQESNLPKPSSVGAGRPTNGAR